MRAARCCCARSSACMIAFSISIVSKPNALLISFTYLNGLRLYRGASIRLLSFAVGACTPCQNASRPATVGGASTQHCSGTPT